MKDIIESGKTALGIEFGSTKIKAVLIDENNNLIATSGHKWENKYENGVWTYSLDDIWKGLQDCYSKLAATVKEKYDAEITKIGAMGFSAMMHGYMAFDKDDTLLVPFRTWRNTITSEASDKLTEVFDFNIPQRWSIAHLYQAVLNKEAHVKDVNFFTTLSGYIHWQLTGKKVLGVGDASGMFPIDSTQVIMTRICWVSLMNLLLRKDLHGKLKIFFRVFSQPVKTQVSLRKREQRNLMFQENFRLVQEFALRKVMPEQEWWQQIVLR